MIYTLNIPDIHREGVVSILQSLQQMGLIEHIEPAATSYAQEGNALSVEDLINHLEAAEAGIRSGEGYTTDQLRKRVQEWKQK